MTPRPARVVCAYHPTGFYANGERCVVPPSQKPATPEQVAAAVAKVLETLAEKKAEKKAKKEAMP